MRKWIIRVLILLVAGVFLFSTGKLIAIRNKYRTSEKIYSDAADEYTRPSDHSASGDAAEYLRPYTGSGSAGSSPSSGADGPAWSASGLDPVETEEKEPEPLYAPLVVDFQRLQWVNSAVEGWIYCEDSVINYPVVAAENNEFYLEHSYTGGYDDSGAIFSDASNLPGFEDSNTILYGHHMLDYSMFASLEYWVKQEYYDDHPYMWLLTPEQDYLLVIFSVYNTYATSDTFTIFRGHGEQLTRYLQWAARNSYVKTGYVPDGEGRYIVLSTCAYSSEDARTVVHGELVPVDSAGGIPLR